MANIAKLEFIALSITGDNYLKWALDVETHLRSFGFEETIKNGNSETSMNRAKALIFIRRHLQEDLKDEYLTVNDPLVLWNNLKERFDHQKTVILPKARYDWIHLRLQDFKSVSEYNSAMFKITSQLMLCGEKISDFDMLEKTFSTFHASNLLLQQQYREKGFTKYSQLISCLLVAEQNNELLMKNHGLRPTGASPLPEANMSIHRRNYSGTSRGRGRGRGHYRGRGRGQGRNFNHENLKVVNPHQKWKTREENNEKEKYNHSNKNNICYRCGMKGHWSRTCRTPKHLVDLYQKSIKGKDKVETNFTFEKGESSGLTNDEKIEDTQFDVADFFSNTVGKMDHFTDGNGDDYVFE